VGETARTGIEIVPTAYGPPAAGALRAAVAAHKAGDPLRPVTVVVPANSVGVAARRLLASTVDGDRHGIVGVTFLTVYRLAELLGAPALAASGRRPVSTPVLGAATRAVLAREPGLFRHVAHHPATEESLVRAHRELSDLDDAQLDALRTRRTRAAEVVRIHRAVRGSIAADFYEERDLMDAATAAVRGGSSVLDGVGAVVVHLPQQLSGPAARLLAAIAERAPLTVVLGCTGEPDADAEPRAALRRLGAEPPEIEIEPPTGTHVVSASDADDEVRHVVREVVRAAATGVALERIGVVYAAEVPYTRLVHEQLTAAGIPHNVAQVQAPADGVVGRTLLTLLELPENRFAREAVAELFTSAPIRDDDGRIPAPRWERFSRDAGVVRGLDQWDARLDRLARELDARREALLTEGSTPEQVEWRSDRIKSVERLRAFVARLGADLDPAAWSGGWHAMVERCRALVRRHLGAEWQRGAWPEHEVELAEAVDLALARLAALDAVEPDPSVDVFRTALEAELTTARGRIGRLGDGVLVGPATMAIGLDLDRVFVLGMAEGTFPPTRRDDSLLPDVDREVVAPDLARRSDRTAREHRALLGAIAAAGDERVLCFPRGDLRRSTEHQPSRWLLDTVERLAGRRVYGDEIDRLARDGVPWATSIASHVDGIARLQLPATEQEHALRSLLAHTSSGLRLDDHALATDDHVIRSALDCVRLRAGSTFTRFDGNLSACSVAAPTDPDVVMSATRLQTWASNPFDFLMEHVLRVHIPESPEDVLDISALDRGSLVHEALERFVVEVLASGPPKPDEPWSAAQRARLGEIAEQICRDYEARGLTGHRLLWRRAQDEITRDLQTVLDFDDKRRAEDRLVPLAAELAFGLGGSDPVAIALSDGSSIRFRGSADRVDRAADGSLVVVDYKTGRAFAATEDDPDRQGTLLQLFVYAHAVRAEFGDADTPVHSIYWFTSTKGGFREAGYPITPEVAARFDVVLRVIDHGIRSGLFPCAVEPSTWQQPWVTYADPDRLGTADRAREWERKQHDPAVALYLALAEPEQPELDFEASS
jgi:hypothetical protein